MEFLREEYPKGYSIEEIAAETGVHRNTVSKYVFGLEKCGKVKISRIVGRAKMYVASKNNKWSHWKLALKLEKAKRVNSSEENFKFGRVSQISKFWCEQGLWHTDVLIEYTLGKVHKENCGEHTAEKRGWHWALTSFAMEVWGETEKEALDETINLFLF